MKLIIATHNEHKLTEFRRMLEPMGIEVQTASLTEADETGKTFMENAFIKAESAMRETGLPAVADDSGICVDALDGAPGIYSARYGTPELDDRGRLELLLREMKDVPDGKRQAHFACAICAVFPNGDTVQAEGECHGSIARQSMGDGGFGYDPIFMQEGRCFGELSAKEKDERSHRGIALRQFAEKLREYRKRNGEKHADK